MYDMTLTIDNKESDTTFEDVISDILSQDNVMFSVKKHWGCMRGKYRNEFPFAC
jgi:hypothetical protein